MMKTSPAVNEWLPFPALQTKARLRLFCFPYAGGNALAYRSWAASLPLSVGVWPVQIPGRGRRLDEPPFDRLRTLVQAMGPALRPYLDEPFAFFGHSMGALIAFELARHLRKEYGIEPRQLFISGRRAPSLPPVERPIYDLPEPEFLSALRELNGTPKEVLDHAELMEFMSPVLRADFAICETYEYSDDRPLGSPITVFCGTQDGEVSREQIALWREQTTSGFRLHMLPGDHFFLNTAQGLLLRALSEELQQLIGHPK